MKRKLAAKKQAPKQCTLHDIKERIEDMVRIFLVDRNMELECRFGRIENGKYVSGVSREFYELCEGLCTSSNVFQSTRPTETHDIFFCDESKAPHRAIVSFDSENLTINTSIDQKTKIKNIDLDCGNNIGIRVTVSKEIEVNKQIFKTKAFDPNFVRIKRRSSHTYRSTKMKHVSFRYDVSKVWSGKTKTEAEMNQHNKKTSYEMEVELKLDDADSDMNTDHMAWSFLSKIEDLSNKYSELLHKDCKNFNISHDDRTWKIM